MHPHDRSARRTILAALGLALAAGGVLALAGCAAPAPAEPVPPPVTIIITRHAEKAPGSPDPDLSPLGRERARALAAGLASYEITTTLTTLTRRAIQTAEPTIAARRIPEERILRVPPATSAAAIADILRARPAGDCILVVSHSNVIPELLKALGIPGAYSLSESDYGRVFVVRFHEGRASLECDKLLEAPRAPTDR